MADEPQRGRRSRDAAEDDEATPRSRTRDRGEARERRDDGRRGSARPGGEDGRKRRAPSKAAASRDGDGARPARDDDERVDDEARTEPEAEEPEAEEPEAEAGEDEEPEAEAGEDDEPEAEAGEAEPGEDDEPEGDEDRPRARRKPTRSSRRSRDDEAADDDEDEEEEDDDDRPARRQDSGSGDRRRRRSGPSPARVIAAARSQVEALTGRRVTAVIGFDRTEEGWEVRLEVLELKRVPETMSILGLLLVQLDEDGELVGYRRVRRYSASQVDEG